MRWYLILSVAAILNFKRGWGSQDCTVCGSECVRHCGTRLFAICCYNFQRKMEAIPIFRNEFEETDYLQDAQESDTANLGAGRSLFANFNDAGVKGRSLAFNRGHY